MRQKYFHVRKFVIFSMTETLETAVITIRHFISHLLYLFTNVVHTNLLQVQTYSQKNILTHTQLKMLLLVSRPLTIKFITVHVNANSL
jgi:hypothetical protein